MYLSLLWSPNYNILNEYLRKSQIRSSICKNLFTVENMALDWYSYDGVGRLGLKKIFFSANRLNEIFLAQKFKHIQTLRKYLRQKRLNPFWRNMQ